jgi:hypothetical protein
MTTNLHEMDATLAVELSRIAHECVVDGKMRHDVGLLLEEAVRSHCGETDVATAGVRVPEDMSPEFTDSARAALLWVLYHHQGGSSPVGQPIRLALGMGAHEPLTPSQVAAALRIAKECHWPYARELPRAPQPPQAGAIPVERPVDPDDIGAVAEAIHNSTGCGWETAERAAVASIDTLIARGNHAPAAQAVAPLDYDGAVSICDAHGIGLPVDCIEMVVEIVKHAVPAPAEPKGEQQAYPKSCMTHSGPDCTECDGTGAWPPEKAALSEEHRKAIVDAVAWLWNYRRVEARHTIDALRALLSTLNGGSNE